MALISAFSKLRASVWSASRAWVCSSSKRSQHTAPQEGCNWQLLDDCFELHYDGLVMHFNYVWLRDHCRSTSSYNFQTNQRNLDTGSIDLNIRPSKTWVDEENLYLTWPDGNVTTYSLAWLAKNSYEGQKRSATPPHILWNSEIYTNANVPSVDWEKFMNSNEDLKTFLKNLLLYGIAFVDGVPATVDATETAAKRIGFIRETMYGRMWSFTSAFTRGHLAYTNLPLDRHTDTSYLQESCGIQVFHCLKHEGTGGRTLLVDGFYSANKVLEESPENFELLSRVSIKHENIENHDNHQNHMVGFSPVFNVHPWNNELYMMRYNNYHRTVIDTVPHDVVQRWYVAHRHLTDELRKPGNELWLKLRPGKVLFLDNWRVLHGRESFTGLRQICGGYLNRDDVLNTARRLGLQA